MSKPEYGVTLSFTFHEPRHKTQEEAEKFIQWYVSRLAENDEQDIPEARWDDVTWDIVELVSEPGVHRWDKHTDSWVRV